MSEKAGYWRDGVHAPEDYRYHAMYEYLKLSPSFIAVLRAIEGKRSPFPTPKDFDQVRTVVEDFRHVMRTPPTEWWRKQGKHLFGIEAPAPMVFVAGKLSSRSKSLNVMWDKNDAVVIRVGINQTRHQALTELGKVIDDQIAKGQFGTTVELDRRPKYSFMRTRLRHSSLALGQSVLKLYESPKLHPLWWIGNTFEVSPAHCFSAKDMDVLDEREIAYRKKIMGIATSRIVKYALLVAENSARGRFPSAAPFPEAQIDLFQRTVGGTVRRRVDLQE